MPGRLPICQHIALGAHLQETREQLMDALGMIHDAYPKTSPTARKAESALRAVDELRNALDNASASEHPADDDWSTSIYYGADRETWERETGSILRRHQRGNPPCCADERRR